ncbi:MAG TPA: hypothetical protein P5186_00745 [Candidatus Paceibacterota bacterium]|nr:hypothetical protein [Verrucomicrobiota bacterium]HRY46548.1 hypothetical protein [Candidatus Paceibacterota bacterium]HRZ99981.1 hypothetical protein [Candidatus Paceibacterota bacterium]
MNESTFNSSEARPAGSFDAERAARLRTQAQDAFLARYRKIERITWIYLLGCLLVAWGCVRQFLAADDVRSWIVWSVLFILAFETTVLMKLWYWVVNTKLAVLREIKLLRLDLALQRGAAEVLDDIARVESPAKAPGLSKGERYAWLGGLILVSLVCGIGVGRQVDRHYRAAGQMTAERVITVAADGAARVEATYELANTTSRALKDFTIYSGGAIINTQSIPAEASPWTDGQGRKLAVRREPDPRGPNRRDVIQLLDPVPPGQRFKLSNIFAVSARRENGDWVLALDQNWGYRRNFYRDTLVLPPGAELVSAEPAPGSQEQRNGQTVLRFEAERGRGEKWICTVKYRQATP